MTVDAQYAIDIATEMPEGEATLETLDKLSSELLGLGKDSKVLQEALAQTDKKLAAATSAADVAAEALAEGSAKYRELERASVRAAKAAERAAAKNDGVAPDGLLLQMQQAERAVNAYAEELRELEGVSSKATAEQQKLAKQMRGLQRVGAHVNETYARKSERLGKVQGAFAALGGPLGRTADRTLGMVRANTEMAEVLGKSRAMLLTVATGAAAVAAAVVALTAVFVAFTAAATGAAIALAEVHRKERLALEAAQLLDPFLGELSNEFGALTRETNLTSAELVGLAKQLKVAKVSVDDMPDALRAVALAQKAVGSEGVSRFVEEVKKGRVEVATLAQETSDKFGGVVARQMLGIGELGTRLRRNFSGLFSGLDLGGAQKGLQVLIGMFEETSATGRFVRGVLATVFQPIIDNLDTVALAVEAFALGFAIQATKVYLAVRPVADAIFEFLGFEDSTLESALGLVTIAGKAVAGVALGLVAVFSVLTALVGGVVAVALGLAVAQFWLVHTAVTTVVDVVSWLIDQSLTLASVVGTALANGFRTAVGWLEDLYTSALALATEWVSIGRDMIAGLVRGLTSGAGAVVSAVTKTMKGAIRAAKKALGIASPSKEFEALADNTTDSYANKTVAKGPEVDQAVAQTFDVSDSDLLAGVPSNDNIIRVDRDESVSPIRAAADLPPSVAPTGGGSSREVLPSIRDNTFNFYGVKDAEDAAQKVEETLTRLLEGDATALGGSTSEEEEAVVA